MAGTDSNLIERFAALPYTGALSDILDEMGLPDQVLPHEIQAIRPGTTPSGAGADDFGRADGKPRIPPSSSSLS